ncbi:unnamed protein product [Phytophthora lilii]|uniref:Unnamed protein product n=1 Tax=Phytophthora lilii TaxID=2077276 RepID=A0A9W7DCA8_9STRA|nr:unnamed protein product [Phytophthora lilii]
MDLAAVGAGLTPAQRDATVADVAWLLDRFGSTRAAREQLQTRGRRIRRLERQVLRLLTSGAALAETEEREEAVAPGVGGVDETMADVAFFLREFGSTRAVRVELRRQENGSRGCNARSDGCGRGRRREVEYLGTKLLDEATKRDQGEEHQQIGVESGVQACRIESGDDDRAGESGTKYGGDFVVLVKKAGSLTTEAEGEVISRQTFDEEVKRLNARNGSGDIHCHENHGTDYSSSATPFPGTETKESLQASRLHQMG